MTMRRGLLGVILLVAGTTGVATASATEVARCGVSPPTAPGTSIGQTITSGGLARSYRVHVPAHYTGHTRLPVVLVLHGGATPPPPDIEAGMEDLTGFSRLADREGFIAVYPRSTERDGSLRWNTGAARDPVVDDVGFIGDVVDRMAASLCADRHRVYVTGFSSGGGMAGILACRSAGRLAAVAAVSGFFVTTQQDLCHPVRPVPILEFHGTRDKVAYDGGPFDDNEFTVPIPEWLAAWANRDGCRRGPAVFLVKDDVTGEHWTGCRRGSTVVHYRITDGLHAWPGVDPGTPTVSATELTWKFFAAHRLP
jgi:polyhydroxybutyrate depolymerase